jgi:hypothetical protein
MANGSQRQRQIQKNRRKKRETRLDRHETRDNLSRYKGPIDHDELEEIRNDDSLSNDRSN